MLSTPTLKRQQVLTDLPGLDNSSILSQLLFFLFATQTRSDIKNGTILQLAISPVGIRLSSVVHLFNTLYEYPSQARLFSKNQDYIELKKSIFEGAPGWLSQWSIRLLISGL